MSEIREIIGNTTATPNPRPDWNQTDETKADYIKNKPVELLNTLNQNIERLNIDKANVADTLEGYGITDAYNKIVMDELLGDKQETLESGINIKTVNGESILDQGNLEVIQPSGGTMTAPLYFTSERSIINNSPKSTIHLLTAKGYDIVTYTPNTKNIQFGVGTHKLNLRGSSINVNGQDISEYLRIPRFYKHLLPLGERDWFGENDIGNAWLEIIDDSSAEYTAQDYGDYFAIIQNRGNLISAKIRFFSTSNADTFYSVLLGSVGMEIRKALWLNPNTNTFANVLDNPMPSDFVDTVMELRPEQEEE